MRVCSATVSLAALFLLVAGPVLAAKMSHPDINAAANQLRLGVGALNQNYKEFNDGLVAVLPSVLDSELGSIPTVEFGASLLREQLYAELQLGLAYGSTTYTGYLQYPGPVYVPYVGKTDNFIFRAQGRVGIPFRPASILVLVPYAEIGDHFWRRDIGYTEDYSHYHIGVGGKMLLRLAPGVVAEAGLGFGTTFLANMRLDGDDFELGSEPYRHGMLAIDIRLAGHWHLRLSGEYRDWQYEQSPVVNGLIEPRSESKQATYLLSVGYNFAK
jgi:hypothetical protein